MLTLPPIADIAEEAFRTRQGAAREAVTAGRIAAEAAERLMRPWAAIACRLGAELPELEHGLADLRASGWSEMQIRARYADDICPRERWAPILAAARDKAIDAAEAAAGKPDHARLVASARRLMRLADHFRRDINGKHHMPPYRTPAQRAADATSERQAA